MKYNALNIPDWFRKNSVYQINPRTFSAEGTINAIVPELPFLKELGFDIMYLCPVFEEDDSEDTSYWSPRQIKSQTGNPKNPYRMNNFFNIDSEYGTIDDLKAFVNECHKLGMRVLLDLVYMHIGPEAPIIKEHPEFAKLDKDGNPIYTQFNFVTLDYNSQGLREYLFTNMVYFISEIGADGFRCDVGDYIPNDFWVEGRKRIRAIKPDAILINEGLKMHRLTTTFDASYDWDWAKYIYMLFTGEKNVVQLREEYDNIAKDLPAGGLILRTLDTHDTVTDWPHRAEKLFGHDGMELVQVMNYVIDGIPMVYAGNELADSAKLSMFANRFHMGEFEVTDRSKKSTTESLRRQEIYKKLNMLLKESDAITRGTFEWVENSKSEDVISFVREYDGQKVFFAGHFRNTEEEVTFDVDVVRGKVVMGNHCAVSENGIHMGAHGYLVLELS